MKLPRPTRSGLWMAVLVSAVALRAQTTANDYIAEGARDWSSGDLDAALAAYSKAVALDPQSAAAYNNRGRARNRLGDLAGALADFNNAIELKPDYPAAYNNRGTVKKQQGDSKGAFADFTKANALDPQHLVGAFNLAAMTHHATFPHIAKPKNVRVWLGPRSKEEAQEIYFANEVNNITGTLDANKSRGIYDR